jgi:tetratricopeptide (TPR) repeat protein
LTAVLADGAAWPIRSGSVPSLADGFITRPESAPGLAGAFAPGTAAALVTSGDAVLMSRGAAVPANGRPAVPANGRAAVPANGGAAGGDWLRPCGKTQFAVHYAESLWRASDVDLLVWVSAGSRAAVLSGFVAAAAATGVGLAATDADAMAVRFAEWLGTTSRRWLVVFDDLSATADLTGLWPAGPSGRLLITAATAASVPPDRAVRVFPVGPFSSREALGYLMDRLSPDPDQRLGAIDLARELDGAPLALAQASGVITSSALTCGDYREHLVRRRQQLAAAAGDGDGGPDGGPPAAAITWSFSVEQAGRLSGDGAAPALLGLAALLDGHAIPAGVLASRAVSGYLAQAGDQDPADPGLAREALGVLERAGLLAADPAGRWQAVRMSPVIQAAVRDAMPGHLHGRAVAAAAAALLEAWPADDRQVWPAAGLRACAASLAQAAGALLWDGGCHPLLLRAGRSLDGGRLTGEAVTYWRDLVAACDTVLGPGHPDTQLASEALASACLAAGRAAEAVPWFQWVLTRRARALGPDQAGTIAARRSLGRALAAANQLGDAITVLDEAAGDYERVRGPGHVDTLDAREDLAAAYQAAGDLAAAIELAERTLADRERIQGPGHADTAATRRRLDELRGRQGAAGRPRTRVAPGLMGSVRGMLSRGSGRARG